MEKCFYVPKKLMDKVLSTAQNTKAIMSCAKLIANLGDDEIRSLKSEMKKIESESESA